LREQNWISIWRRSLNGGETQFLVKMDIRNRKATIVEVPVSRKNTNVERKFPSKVAATPPKGSVRINLAPIRA
jgi:hypothetical protein